MSNHPVKVITFDLWDTIVIDESDEPKRAVLGLAPKPLARRVLLHESLCKHENIIGFKDSSSDPDRFRELKETLEEVNDYYLI